ncbi:hypothetical protein FB451DRAFT_1180122 [Mycena latifolia]|nr:hypothetical protein FB451DRAFT_1180122 [Mycena latifolia]
MPKGVTVAESMCWTVVRMLVCRKSPQEIHAFTDVSPRQQRRIFKLWRETSEVKRRKDGPELQGRPRKLTSQDVAVLTAFSGSVDETCDTYLEELQESLGFVCGAEASQATIWRTLQRKGYRMKKVG